VIGRRRRRRAARALPPIALAPSADTPIGRQIAGALRNAILAGQISIGTRLPSTRALAEDLGVSRNTVLEAYAQLYSEGFLDRKSVV